MQRTVGSRGTRVLMFGLNWNEWLEEKGMVKGGLQSMHMGWSFSSGATQSVEYAVEYIKKCVDLELVTIGGNSARRPHDEMLRVASGLARALNEHPYKPWIHISDSEMNYLEPVFETTGLTVVYGPLEHVISERWRSQMSEEIAA